VVGDHVLHHLFMFQILGWAALALTGLELSMGVRSLIVGRLRRAV